MAEAAAAAPKAILDFVKSGTYPEDNDVVGLQITSSSGSSTGTSTKTGGKSKNASSATLESLGKLLSQARRDVQTSIRELSALSAPDIDGWIAQAKQIRADRDASIEEATQIESLHREYGELRSKTQDAAAKVRLLEGEVGFTEGLIRALDAVKKTKEAAREGARLLKEGDLVGAVKATQKAQELIDNDSKSLETLKGTSALDLLGERVAEQREEILRASAMAWEQLVVIDEKKKIVKVKSKSEVTSLQGLFDILGELELLGPRIAGLNTQLDDLILKPRFDHVTGASVAIHVDGDSISLKSLDTKDTSIARLLGELVSFRKWLRKTFPQAADVELQKLTVPRIQEYIMLNVLPKAVPPSLDGLSYFKDVLSQVSSFATEMESLGWKDMSRLTAWVDNAPQVWLQTRSADSLNSLRQVLKRGLGNPRSVERVETQTIVEGDGLLAPEEDTDTWDESWDEGNGGGDGGAASAVPTEKKPPHEPGSAPEEDEDASGWGWEDEEGEEKPAEGKAAPGKAAPGEDEDDGGADAWDAWDDSKGGAEGEDEIPTEQTMPPTKQKAASQPNGKPKKSEAVERTMTLRESYHITALPEQILEVLVMAVEDADTLSKSSNDASNPVAAAGPSLYALPGVLLAMFRAAAPMAYGMNDSGNMYLYNDSQYLAEQLRSFSEHHASRFDDGGGHDMLVLQPDISALEIFGKRAYSREMDAQRTILGDLLDGAQGFVNCTEEPQAGQCDLAVTSVIDRIRQVHAQWREVLSPSALLQAVGSLLSTVVSKVIMDVEDLSDIGEAESRRLTGYCTSISSLEDIFPPPNNTSPDSSNSPNLKDSVPSTAVYVPTWLKFQYLSNILESNLVDIKYLWQEGGLPLEFEQGELVDLVEALFADSPRRRELVGEIRRGG